MAKFTILVRFRITDGRMSAFLPLMIENAEASRRDEPGCERFDVLQPDGAKDMVLLYEIYSDRAAFDAHCASPHFKHFDVSTKSMVAEKEVTVLDLLAEP
ncbi:Quinol monooxygenase YgiN [Hyphomicrobiales bacterium]|jgi:quinol monooxygenase YgiN|nr:Quinol monooxygenase YgiN [Hyphomicrobiales bacterium]CAH1702184.1 Quinol monooxygenase YgiN [Hyphomicrobiales bacterium]CAI0346388.1 (4S)-4-hydroxy-5-phosphonooxypentane-2,3-dione isomerase [Hyphomicrobiales bacterium]